VVEHIPVLLSETLIFLDVKQGGVYADLTLGLGGHAKAVLERLGPEGRLIGVDRDDDAIAKAKENLMAYSGRLTIIKSDFAAAAGLIADAGFGSIDGFLMDLGVSSLQLMTPERGFSFQADAPLDMRMDRSSGITAAGLLMKLSEDELTKVIKEYGEERWARAIARRIVERRKTSPVKTTPELAEEVKRAIPRGAWPDKLHPATRTFQALRIAVNGELESLGTGLGSMLEMLKPGGRAVVLSYHSLEDRLVKQTFREWAKGCICPKDFPMCVCGRSPRLKVLTTKPVLPSEAETENNPRSRSAKLRAAERL